MKNRMSVRAKLLTGFIAMMALMLILGIISFFSLQQVGQSADLILDEEVPKSDAAMEAMVAVIGGRDIMGEYLLENDLNKLGQLEAEYDEYATDFDMYINAIIYGSESDDFKRVDNGKVHEMWVKDGLDEEMVVPKGNDEIIRLAREADEFHSKFDENAHETMLHHREALKAQEVVLNESEMEARAFMELVDEFSNKADLKMDEVEEAASKSMKGAMINADNAFAFAVGLIIAIAGISIVIGISVGLILSANISNPLNKISEILNKSSNQIASASTQLSSSSQEIANGATEQASSIEETTSSMEELASMVKQNVSNAQEASNLAEKASQDSQEGHSQMEKMLESMTEINKSSGQISKIIKVIDDIAFQTNILALNAAVEAARAGEAGMGFAVVADEVKNLANRSAQAAKETSAMIEDSIKRTESGLTIANKLAESFKEILNNIQKVAEMAKEVETASKQQDSGINQVNKAIVQFDEVVQANASSAEETASSAEELLSQVETLNDVVKELVLVVTGKADMKSEYDRKYIEQKKLHTTKRIAINKTGVNVIKKKKKEVTPEKVIPFEEDEDFIEID